MGTMWIIKELIAWPIDIALELFDIARGRSTTQKNRLPYYGDNHNGSPW
jgi:hypothetical protein